MSSKARASFLFRDTIKLLGEFKLRHPHTKILQTFFSCCFLFSSLLLYSVCLKHFSYFEIDRFIYLFIQFVFYPPPVKNTFRINLKFTIEPASHSFFNFCLFHKYTFYIQKRKWSFQRRSAHMKQLFTSTNRFFQFFFNVMHYTRHFIRQRRNFKWDLVCNFAYSEMQGGREYIFYSMKAKMICYYARILTLSSFSSA